MFEQPRKKASGYVLSALDFQTEKTSTRELKMGNAYGEIFK